MDSKNLGERSSYQLMSLASRIKAIHHAMTAEELADLLKARRRKRQFQAVHHANTPHG